MEGGRGREKRKEDGEVVAGSEGKGKEDEEVVAGVVEVVESGGNSGWVRYGVGEKEGGGFPSIFLPFSGGPSSANTTESLSSTGEHVSCS
ncbi:hypothetical protein ACH5RR_000410 [Cinchona calisaya]|uniref:Uncharacterized protein n=1 Tax=Cinchona calisaya TaxID=153742 RepID=A0ABD3B0M5_9GENT